MKNNLDEDIEILKHIIEFYKNLDAMYGDETCDEIKAIENVLSELETYKKIAERLAKFACRIANYDSSELEQKVKETIDWARKEVEKDDN
jgi:hypothetical protein